MKMPASAAPWRWCRCNDCHYRTACQGAAVYDSDGLIAGRHERDAGRENMHARIVQAEAVIGREHRAGVGIGGREANRTKVVGIDIAVWVQGSDDHIEG